MVIPKKLICCWRKQIKLTAPDEESYGLGRYTTRITPKRKMSSSLFFFPTIWVEERGHLENKIATKRYTSIEARVLFMT